MIKNKNYIRIIMPAAVWFVVWVLTQGLFMSNILVSTPGDFNAKTVIATVYIFMVIVASFVIMPRYRKESLPKSKLLLLYIIPATLLMLMPGHYALSLHLPVYALMITVTVFWQDYVTFGILQPHLATQTTKTSAALLTAALFLLGHAVFFLNNLLDPQFLLIAGAGIVFALSRRYLGSIYIANVLHLCFYLM